MNDLSTDVTADNAAPSLDTQATRLGFVRHEPLDTMLKLERLPPPVLSSAAEGDLSGQAHARPASPNTNARRHQSIKMRLELAELILSSEDKILASGDSGAIEGLNEVHRFLLHSEHLRLLQES